MNRYGMSAANMRDLRSEEDFEAILAESRRLPQFILKHSTRCPVSAWAYGQFSALAARGGGAGFAVVRVIEHRAVSDAIAARLGVAHESPQVILLAGGRAVWHASHYEAGSAAMEGALRRLQA